MIEDRYYTTEEYLTPEQKKDLASKRFKRGRKPGAKESKVKGQDDKSSKDVMLRNLKCGNRQVSQLAKRME